LMGLGLVGLIVTGLTMVKKRSAKAKIKRNQRWVHRLVGAIACLPLLVSAVTGIAYRLGNAWFGLSQSQASLLMTLHEGRYLGNTLKPLYVLSVGIGLVVLLITGIQMTGMFRQKEALQTRGD
ncbi:MAG: PepSY domain-containing protein, partial [Leptolyngbyaceae bacterium]|nr:PepSY domain-containing protein [Leptolyngbyaceae bacterium]